MARQSKPGDRPNPNGGKDPELFALGKRLRELREATGLTQEGLAHAAGLHWTYVGQIERGGRNLTYKNVLKLARGLDVSPAKLHRRTTAHRSSRNHPASCHLDLLPGMP